MKSKSDVVTAVSEWNDLPVYKANAYVESVFEYIRQELIKGEGVVIQNFGKFTKTKLKARKSRNPKTGEPVDVPERTKVSFKASSMLKSLLGEGN
jgi:nucleoid DNA-binding protein